MKSFGLVAVVVIGVMLVVAACSGNGDDRSSDRSSVANTLRVFSQAFNNGNIEDLQGLWSGSCTKQERFLAEETSRLLATGRQPYQLEVLNVDQLVLDFVDDDHVVVPQEQPSGALRATFGAILASGVEIPDDKIAGNVDLEFVREDSEWRVANCRLYDQEKDDDS